MPGNQHKMQAGGIPEAIRPQAAALRLSSDDCLFCAQSDIGLDGAARETWLVVTSCQAVTLSEAHSEPESGPFDLAKVQKVRLHQAVGSAFLQFVIDGLNVDIIRFSNARREMFARVHHQLERLITGQPLEHEAFSRPSGRSCATCGLPLPVRGEACPRCKSRGGIFLRTVRLMRPFWMYSLLLLGLLLLRVGLNLVPPYLVKVLVDNVLEPRGNHTWLVWFVLGLLTVSAVLCVVNVLAGRLGAAVGARIGRELRETLHNKLIAQDVEYFDRHSVGGLMSRVLWDVEYLQNFVQQVAEGFLLNVLMILGIGSMLFYMNWSLALMVLLPLPLVVVGTTVFWKRIYPRYYPVWESQSKMAQHLSSVLSGVRTVKIFGQEARETGRFSDSAAYMQDARYTLGASVATFYPILGFVFGLGGLVIWYYGGSLVLSNQITIGTLMAFFSYLGMFYWPIQSLSMFSNWTTGFVSAGQRIFEILDCRPRLLESPAPVKRPHPGGSVELRNVTFGYDQHTPVLKEVNLRVPPGGFVGIVGKSGSGKTTLVNLICRFYDAQRGQVCIDGIDVRELPVKDLRDNIALVLQEPFLFRSSIRDNIAYGCPDASAVSVVEAAKAANAHEFIVRLPAGYDTMLGERGAGLSGGERQRLTIARALLRKPRILILDEATSSVDTETELGIQRGLTELSRECTTIVIAHRLSTLKNANRIYVIDNGRTVEFGTHSELMDLDGTYARLVRVQTELAAVGGN